MTPRMVVVGGGLAGLTAACDLADAALRVTVLDARARLGGATFSFRRDGLTVDNGQHVLLRSCDEYRNLLRRLGTPVAALRELARLCPAAATLPHTRFFVARERRATFRRAPATARLRPEARPRLPGPVVAGAWTDTGWPDALERAVRSGARAARLVAARARGALL